MERAVPVLPADDLRVAKDFYATRLGFRVLFEASDDGKSGLHGLARGTVQITVDSPKDGEGRNDCFSREVYGAEAHYEEWCKKVDVPRPPKNESWGARTFDL